MFKRSLYLCSIFTAIAFAAASSFAQQEKNISSVVIVESSDYLLSDADMYGYQMSSQEIQTWPLSPKDGKRIAIAGVRQAWQSSQGKKLIVSYGSFDSPENALDAAALFMTANHGTFQGAALRWQKKNDKSWILSAEGKEIVVFVRDRIALAVESKIDSEQDRANLEAALLKVLGKIAMSRKSKEHATHDQNRRTEIKDESAVVMPPPKAIEEPGWIKYAEPSSGTKLYYDKESIVKTNTIVSVWLKSELDISRFKDLSKGYTKTRQLLQEVDCIRKKGRLLLAHDYLTNGKEESTTLNGPRQQFGWSEDESLLYRILCPNEPQPESICSNSEQPAARMPDSEEAGLKFKTHEELVSYYIDALNSNDEVKLRQTVHPASLREITAENSIFYEEMFEEELGYFIPKDAIITYTKLENPNSFLIEPASDRYCYPIKPTHKFALQFSITRGTGRTITKYVLESDSGWLILLERPKEKYLKDLVARKKKQLEIEKHADALVLSMDKSVYGKIVEYLKLEDMEKAVVTFEQQPLSGQDKSYSVVAVKRIITKENIKVRGVSPE